MKPSPGLSGMNEEEKRIWRAAGMAAALEILFFLALGLGNLPFLRNPFDSADYVDAQIVQLPANTHLTGATAVKDDDEIVFNRKRSWRKKEEKKETPKAPEQNQVESSPDLGPTHGPVAFYTPAPVIPAYLRNQNLKTSVVIEFLITAQGAVAPRLLDSCGNDELDAIALRTAAQWQFKPAAKDNVPVDSKTRLRILFEVY